MQWNAAPRPLDGFTRDGVTRKLQDAGFSLEAATGKAERFVRCARALRERGHRRDAPAFACFVPGRIEVLGKHTDYAGGSSIVCAADRGFCFLSVDIDQAEIAAIDVAEEHTERFPFSGDIEPRHGHWSNYPMTVARRVARNFAEARGGVEFAFSSDLPPASGMSSSSALIVGCLLLLARRNELSRHPLYTKAIRTPEDLAGYAATIENGQTFGALRGDMGVGTFGGSEDHTAILCCRAGRLCQYAYCPVRLERTILLPERFQFAIAYSGVLADKTGAAQERYNRASRLAAEATRIWRTRTQREDPHLASALHSADDAPERMRALLAEFGNNSNSPSELLDRFEHFLCENEQLIPAAGDALAWDDAARFGRLVERSQMKAEDLLGNQVEETRFLARSARVFGAAAASSFGAGFGGSVWAMVESDRLETFLEQWRQSYAGAYGDSAERSIFFATRPAPAAFFL